MAESIPADYTELTDEVNDLRSAFQTDDLSFLADTYGKSVKDDGTINESRAAYAVSDYVKIPDNAIKVRIGNSFYSGASHIYLRPAIAFYDSNKAFLSPIATGVSEDWAEFSIPDGAQYLRFNQGNPKNANVHDIINGLFFITDTEPRIEALESELPEIKAALTPSYCERIQNGISDTTTGKKYGAGGAILDDSSCAISNDYLYAEAGDVCLMLYAINIVRYNLNKVYQTYFHIRETDNYSGQERWNVWVVPTTGYYRFTFANTSYGYAVTKLDKKPFEIVCLGDSIFGNNQPPYDLPTYIETMTGIKTANCAFGGTEAGTWDAEQYPNMQYMVKYNPVSFCGIADAIATGDWSAIDIDWATLYSDSAFMPNKYLLVNEVDFAKVRLITVAFGANDWSHKRVMDNPENRLDTSTFKGALRYGTEKILTAYPNITLAFLSPIWGYAYTGTADYTKNTDNTPNGDGVYQTAYIEAMAEVAEEYHMPFFDNYKNGIINALNGRNMIRDKSHLNTGMGVDRMGRLIGAEIKNVMDFIPNYMNGNIL